MNPEEYGEKHKEHKANKNRRRRNTIIAAAPVDDDEREEAKISTGTGIREALLHK